VQNIRQRQFRIESRNQRRDVLTKPTSESIEHALRISAVGRERVDLRRDVVYQCRRRQQRLRDPIRDLDTKRFLYRHHDLNPV
jgi:hypothetical protein